MTDVFTPPALLRAPIASAQHVVLAWNPSVALNVAPVLTGTLITVEHIRLDWTEGAVNGVLAESYDIYRSVNSGSFTLLANVSDRTYDDDYLDLDTTSYEYYVVARVGSDTTDPSNHVTFGDPYGGGIVDLYDVRDHANFPEGGLAYAIDLDATNNRIFLVACDRRVGPAYASHIVVWNLDVNGDLGSVAFTEDYTLFPDEVDFTVFREYFSIYYPGGSKFHVIRYSGASTMDYDTSTGNCTPSSHYYDLGHYAGIGRYGLLNGMVLKPGGNPYFVSSAGRNSFLQAVPVPTNADQGLPIATSRETYYNQVAKLTGSETIFYVADSGGGSMTRNSIDSAGAITLLDSVLTGMTTSGLDDGHMVHCACFQGYLYAQEVTTAQQSPLQPTRRWPITNPSTGTLGTHEDGTWDFRGNYPYLIALGNPGFRQAFEHNGHTYFIRGSDGDQHKLSRT